MSDQPVLIPKIGLSKLFLWMEAERLESYPETFSKFSANSLYTKKTLATNTIGLIKNEAGEFVRDDFLINLFGMERKSDNKILIRGINALQKVSDEFYKPSQMAIEIGQAYHQNNKTVWLNGFAKMIACFEIRTRLMLYLLGKAGYSLFFPTDRFFGMGTSRAELHGHGNTIQLFANTGHEFNTLLQQHRWTALGPWWADEIHASEMEITNDFMFEGLRDPQPPTNKLNDRIKNSMFLMKYLDILVDQAGEWVVNPVQATAIFGEEVAQDFVEIAYVHGPIQHLQQWKSDIQDALGFVVVADLVQRWGKYKVLTITQAEQDFDEWMRLQIYQGRVRILETHAGQPRLGRGLFGDDTARKIRFDMVEA